MESGYRFGRDEIAKVMLQSNEVRYEYFVKRVADWGEVWGLKNPDGWVLCADGRGNEIAVFWPFKEYAELCAASTWIDTEATKIDIEAFLDRWLPGLHRDGRQVGVFPNVLQNASVVDALELQTRLIQEREGLE